MTTAQKIIKYLAMAFAIFLIVMIVSGILLGLHSFGNFLGIRKKDEANSTEIKEKVFEFTELNELSVDIAYADFKIKNGDSLKVETNIDKIDFNEEKNILKIKEKKNNNWFNRNNNKILTLYIPENMEISHIEISTGAGKVDIESLKTKILALKLGAGETIINDINVYDKCKIDSGAGKLSINSSSINNLDFDMGVGESDINAKITGKNDIDAGVGRLNINLNGEKEDYTIKADKGVGSIKIAGENVSNDEIIGNGEHYIDIDGGIGSIEINFIKE